MKQTIVFVLCLIPFWGIGQINYQHPPWDLACSTLTTQTEMNICSGQKRGIADSILIDLYQKNLKYYNKLIAELVKDLEPSGYNPFITIRNAFIQSQNQFVQYRESLCNLESLKWEGGSVKPLMVNTTFLEITVQRIKWVEQEYINNMNR